MSSSELNELHEHGNHARHAPDMKPVTLTMAILAVCVAAVSMLGHRTHTDEIVNQNDKSNSFNQYQAKIIRRNMDQGFSDLTGIATSQDPAERAILQNKYQAEVQRYDVETAKFKKDGEESDGKFLQARARAELYDLGEVFLEIALVITSITLLSGQRKFWYLGLAISMVGVVTIIIGWMGILSAWLNHT